MKLSIGIVVILVYTNIAYATSYYSIEDQPYNLDENGLRVNQPVPEPVAKDPNQDFWDTLHQASMFTKKKPYNILHNEKVCFTCPIDRETFASLYQEAAKSVPGGEAGLQNMQQTNMPAPPRVSISWATQLPENRIIFFCRNNTRIATTPIHLSSDYDPHTSGNSADESARSGGGMVESQLEYSCENNRLCLSNVKNNYPHAYQCYVKSYVLNVKLNVIGNLNLFSFWLFFVVSKRS